MMSDILEDLVSPEAPDSFFARYWEKQPLLLKGNAFAARIALNCDDLTRMPVSQVRCHSGLPDSHRTRLVYWREIKPSSIQQEYEAGATVCVEGLEAAVPQLGANVRALKTTLGFAGVIDCRAYLSGEASGFTMHFDARSAFICQIEGEKEWRIGRCPCVPFPLANGRVDGSYGSYARDAAHPHLRAATLDAPQSGELEVVRLCPGDALYLPAGVWHEALSASHSLALNVSFNHWPRGCMLDVLLNAISRHLGAEPEWRRPVMFAPEYGESDLRRRAAVALSRCGMRGRIRALVETLEQITTEDDEVLSSFLSLALQSTGPIWYSDVAVARRSASEDSLLYRNPDILAVCIVHGKGVRRETCSLFVANSRAAVEVLYPGVAHGTLEHLTRLDGPVSVNTLIRESAEPQLRGQDVRHVVETLVAMGVLTESV